RRKRDEMELTLGELFVSISAHWKRERRDPDRWRQLEGHGLAAISFSLSLSLFLFSFSPISFLFSPCIGNAPKGAHGLNMKSCKFSLSCEVLDRL
ncbi:hypothetical protein, partial [Bosea sp. (in: a-proteobacteria)]|uniref:hypothetical protein n=1 Tax=Bosea sp. (in: a-proteobacteria) TaxID=1871050 RepID=UPI0040335081